MNKKNPAQEELGKYIVERLAKLEEPTYMEECLMDAAVRLAKNGSIFHVSRKVTG